MQDPDTDSFITRLDTMIDERMATKFINIPIVSLAKKWSDVMFMLTDIIISIDPISIRERIKSAAGYLRAILTVRIVKILQSKAIAVYLKLSEDIKNLNKNITFECEMDFITHSLVQNIGCFIDTSPTLQIKFIPRLDLSRSTESFQESLATKQERDFGLLMALFKKNHFPMFCPSYNDVNGTPWFLLEVTRLSERFNRISGRFSPSLVSDIDLSLAQLFGCYLKYEIPNDDDFISVDKDSNILEKIGNNYFISTILYTLTMNNDIAIRTIYDKNKKSNQNIKRRKRDGMIERENLEDEKVEIIF